MFRVVFTEYSKAKSKIKIIMVAKNKINDKNWEKLVSSLKKGITEMEKEKGKEQPTAIEVICSKEDIEKTRES